MPRSVPFRDLKTARRDGSTVEVRHGSDQEIVEARWSSQNKAWIRIYDPLRGGEVSVFPRTTGCNATATSVLKEPIPTAYFTGLLYFASLRLRFAMGIARALVVAPRLGPTAAVLSARG